MLKHILLRLIPDPYIQSIRERSMNEKSLSSELERLLVGAEGVEPPTLCL